MIVEEERYLAHYGVLGMKWGKRKAARYEKRASKLDTKLVKKMANEEMLNFLDKRRMVKSAKLMSKANDLKSNKKVTMKEMNKKASDAKVKANKRTADYNKRTKAKKDWDKNFNENWYKAYNKAADYANKVLIPQINKKYKNKDLKKDSVYEQYEKEYETKFNKVLQQNYDEMFGKRPK